MRNCDKNKRLFYGVNYLGTTDVIDTQGNKTGEKLVSYGDYYEIKANISGAKGDVNTQVFGNDIRYDKTFVLTLCEFLQLGIDDNSVFFVNKKPSFDENNVPKYDYKVVKIAETINEVVIAISKVS